MSDNVFNEKWRYGEAGDRWPVMPGEVWQLGEHVVACADLETGCLPWFIQQFGPVDLFYADPPWDAANATGFRTKAGFPKKVRFTGFLRVLAAGINHLSCPALIEMGSAHELDLCRALESAGYKITNSWGITYYKTKPCRLVRAVRQVDPEFSGTPEGMDDMLTPRWAIETHTSPGDTVLDCCTGRGLTLTTAHELGRRFIGTELNPRRLAVGIDLLASQGVEPRRLGTNPKIHPASSRG